MFSCWWETEIARREVEMDEAVDSFVAAADVAITLRMASREWDDKIQALIEDPAQKACWDPLYLHVPVRAWTTLSQRYDNAHECEHLLASVTAVTIIVSTGRLLETVDRARTCALQRTGDRHHGSFQRASPRRGPVQATGLFAKHRIAEVRIDTW